MQVIKAYDPETQSKILIPVTTWMRSNFPYDQLFCVPLPEDKQPLYNLDLLLKEETRAVALTDGMAFADFDRDKASDGVVSTSFFCSPGQYDQMDWSPLRDKEEIFYLVCNYSGISLEAAYLKARELADFLYDQYDIKLKFIQLKVDYPSCLYRQGFRFRLHDKKLPVKPDIVLPKYKTVIEVRGCFWHRHPGCKETTTPSTDVNIWKEKFEKNIARDQKTKAELHALGWQIIVIWECELKKKNFLKNMPAKILGTIEKTIIPVQ